MASLLNSYCCIVDGCKYRKVGGWSVCDPTKKMKTIQVVLKKGDLRTCITKKTISKSCRSQTNQANRKKKKQSGRVDLQTITITAFAPANISGQNIVKTELKLFSCFKAYLYV